MASCVLSVEHVEITITSTNTTGTADITLGQTAANCILLVTFMSATGASTINTRLPEVYFSDTDTITAQRTTGTDIGTITVMVEVIEFDPAQVKVQQGTFSMSNTVTSDSVNLAEAVSSDAAAFIVHNNRTSYSSTNYARNAFCTVEFTDASTITFTRSAGGNTLQGRYFLAEALNSEFIVQHGTITLANSAETNDDPLPDDVELGRTALFVSMLNGHTGDNWADTGVRAFLQDISTVANVSLSRSNGGSAAATSVTCRYQAVTFGQDETVQRGVLTITGTSDTDTLGTAISLDSATVHSPMMLGLGEGNDTDGTLVGGWFAHMELTATDTVTGSVVTDVTPAGVYSYEVIDWAVDAGATVESTMVAQFESLEGLAVTATLQFESLEGLESTATLQFESLEGIEATAVAQFESLEGIESTAVAQFESLEGVESTAVAQFESLEGVESTAVLQFESIESGTVSSTMVAQFESLAGLDSTMVAQFEALEGVDATVVAQFESIKGIESTAVAQFESLGAPAAPAAPIKWQSPRGIGIVTIDRCAPHVRMWNPDIEYTWTDGLVTMITETAPDGTVAVMEITWDDGKIVQIDRWVEQ